MNLSFIAWHETLIWQEHRCQDISYQVFTIWISSRGVLFTKTCFCVFETDINHRISVKELKSQTFPSSKTCIHESIHLHHYGHEDDFDFNAEELVAISNQYFTQDSWPGGGTLLLGPAIWGPSPLQLLTFLASQSIKQLSG